MNQAADNFRNREYWAVENVQYAKPSFRLRKCARFINEMAGDRPCTLLDVGCGPAALRPLLAPNVQYFGIDIAIQQRAPYLREADIAHEPIIFDHHRFDFVVALGFFEYMGGQQQRKFDEIKAILKDNGKFMMSYINFGHFRKQVWPNYNNVQSASEMAKSLRHVFHLERQFPASHHWRQKQPGESALPALQMKLNFKIPIVSSLSAVEYFFICSRRG